MATQFIITRTREVRTIETAIITVSAYNEDEALDLADAEADSELDWEQEEVTVMMRQHEVEMGQ